MHTKLLARLGFAGHTQCANERDEALSRDTSHARLVLSLLLHWESPLPLALGVALRIVRRVAHSGVARASSAGRPLGGARSLSSNANDASAREDHARNATDGGGSCRVQHTGMHARGRRAAHGRSVGCPSWVRADQREAGVQCLRPKRQSRSRCWLTTREAARCCSRRTRTRRRRLCGVDPRARRQLRSPAQRHRRAGANTSIGSMCAPRFALRARGKSGEGNGRACHDRGASMCAGVGAPRRRNRRPMLLPCVVAPNVLACSVRCAVPLCGWVVGKNMISCCLRESGRSSDD
eukprot:6988771-Prymnesium_polylepis.1